ncbi:MAG: hypothetical protein EOO62_09260 [Hymenobacter sp.]|nr:MAG: hypothetical protein EOO62_09260 [Hymenobacter sp.]
MTQLVLLAHSREAEYHRAIFAVLSFWAWHKGRATGPVQAVVFTDQPAFFAPYLSGLPVRYELLTPARLAAMQQPHGYVHRVKAAILVQVAQTYPQDELLFVDSDTFFIALPDLLLQQLAAGATFLHKREYTITEAVGVYATFGQAHFPTRLLEVLASRRFEVAGAAVQFQPEQVLWNSGVLGLPAAASALLPDVLRVLDELYLATNWFTCEQIAFSLVLQAQTTLRPCDKYVFHYWGKRQKQLMDERLPLLLSELRALPLAERLAHVRQLIPRWQRTIELDRLHEGALYAFAQGQLLAGLKYGVKAWLIAPLNFKLAKGLWWSARKKARPREGRLT